MHRRSVLLLAVVIAFAPGCKGMGGFAKGFGKVAGGAARGLGKVAPAIAQGVAKAGPVLVKGASHVGPVLGAIARNAPAVLRVTESLAEVALTMPDLNNDVEGAMLLPQDPCNACLVRNDDDCETCAGYDGYACMPAPPGAFVRCTSSAPPNVVPAPAPIPDGTTAASP